MHRVWRLRMCCSACEIESNTSAGCYPAQVLAAALPDSAPPYTPTPCCRIEPGHQPVINATWLHDVDDTVLSR
jgi:hypothetical protein